MSMDAEAVLVYGGSFDPPHVAHVLSVAYALAVEPFERVLVVPVCEHAFPKHPVAFEHRARMCELAFGDFERVEVSRIEAELEKPNRTVSTLKRLLADQPSYRLRLLIGSDVLGDAAKWHAFDEVKRLAPPFVVARHGFERPEYGPPPVPNVSSTELRELLRRRGSEQVDTLLRRCLPWRVREYIEANGLYRG
jgi:nicotinate-nucleotide adenylyltransferase